LEANCQAGEQAATAPVELEKTKEGPST